MRYVLLAFWLAVVPGAVAQEDDGESRRTEALYEFINDVADVARAMHLDGKVGIARTDEVLDGDPTKPAAIGKIPDDDPLRERVAWILFIKNEFLDDHPAGGLAHAATHEICHAVLGHLERMDDEDGEEYEAEKCAYLYMGEDAYIAFMRADAARSDENRHYAEMDEREFRNVIRRYFGYDELEPQ